MTEIHNIVTGEHRVSGTFKSAKKFARRAYNEDPEQAHFLVLSDGELYRSVAGPIPKHPVKDAVGLNWIRISPDQIKIAFAEAKGGKSIETARNAGFFLQEEK